MNKLVKWTWIVSLLFLVMLTFESIPKQIQASSLMKSFSVKITVIDKGTEYEWEYHNPSEYEYEHGEKVIKNDEAKKEVEKMITMLDIKETAKVEDMVFVLQENGFKTMERLDVRWINGENQLYTWVWDKKS